MGANPSSTASPAPQVPVAERVEVPPAAAPRAEPGSTTNPRKPWSPEELAKWPKDSHELPWEQKPFLHTNMIWGGDFGSLKEGRTATHQFDLDRFLASLPEAVRSSAQAQREQLLASIADLDKAARELEKEHWKSRSEAYHAAIEAGCFEIIDVSGIPDLEAAHKVAAVREGLGLGELNRDYYYMVSSARGPNRREYGDGKFSAMIYVRRSQFPESFALLDEVERTVAAAEDVIRARLGVPR